MSRTGAVPAPDAATGRGVLLLVGMPRSGTTWTGKLLDAHPATRYLHEPDSARRIPVGLAAETAGPAEAAAVREWLRAALADRSARVNGKLPLFRKRWRGPVEELRHRASVYLAKLAARRGVARPVHVGRRAEGAPAVWKSIESLARLGALLEALPELRVAVLVRHPCGYVASVLRGERAGRFSDTVPAADDWGVLERLLATQAARAIGVTRRDLAAEPAEGRLAWRWVLAHAAALAAAARSGGGRVRLVRYEDCCRDPAGAAGTMLGLLGLGLHPQVRRFAAASTRGDGGGYYGVRRDPARAAARWREELPAAVQRRVLAIVREAAPPPLHAEAA